MIVNEPLPIYKTSKDMKDVKNVQQVDRPTCPIRAYLPIIWAHEPNNADLPNVDTCVQPYCGPAYCKNVPHADLCLLQE